MSMTIYDLDGVDDQHPLSKLVGKYVMVNRVNGVDILWLESFYSIIFRTYQSGTKLEIPVS